MTRERLRYTGRKTSEISFPLGGIGTGCIGVAGNGRLTDWEIYNRPNKGGINGFSHFAIKAEAAGQLLDARLLNADLQPPYSGSGPGLYAGFGFGPAIQFLTGVPHFKTVEFLGEFPIAQLAFTSEKFPGTVSMTAFNPFIPLNVVDSGIPGAFFEFEVCNTSNLNINYTLAGVLDNPLPECRMNNIISSEGLTLLHLTSNAFGQDETNYGELVLATDATDVSWQQYWCRGQWFDALEVYWRDFTNIGKLVNREVASFEEPSVVAGGNSRPGVLATHIAVAPGETKRVRFVITWNFPNNMNYWNSGACDCAVARGIPVVWKNYYATIWPDAPTSATYALREWDRLYRETVLFKEALFSSTLPLPALDAVSANLSVLKSPTVLLLEDGTFYGWEGCHTDKGSCDGTCTHVWNYQQALPFLFPKLERSMREVDYQYNLQPDGRMPFRLGLPLGTDSWQYRPCADGQFGGMLKVYRDWKISGDTAWLRQLWPAVKKALEYAWAPSNADQWDPEKTGVLQGRQHHTLDCELFGPNSWLSGFYLGALKAAAEMAACLGETETATEYRAIFKRGKQWVDAHLFNGEYYHQVIDLKDRSLLEPFTDAYDYYWSEEHQEIRYQLGEASEIDQVVAQWHANLYGLGEIFAPGQTRAALKAIFKYNFRVEMREFFNACRVFCLNDESGMVITHWPEHVYRPMVPIPYAGEVFTGFEYAAASHMIQEGLVEEGMAVVKAVRARFDGERRNPWNEFECGSNYARSMASYALLNAFSGFQFDMTRGMIGFTSVKLEDGCFQCFWSLDSGWGTFEMKQEAAELTVLYGHLSLQELRLPNSRKAATLVILSDKKLAFEQVAGAIQFTGSVVIESGETLRVE